MKIHNLSLSKYKIVLAEDRGQYSLASYYVVRVDDDPRFNNALAVIVVDVLYEILNFSMGDPSLFESREEFKKLELDLNIQIKPQTLAKQLALKEQECDRLLQQVNELRVEIENLQRKVA